MRCSVCLFASPCKVLTHYVKEKWQLDEDKLTFIILSRETQDIESRTSTSLVSGLPPTDERITSLPMIGDVNMFLSGPIPQTSDKNIKPIETNRGPSGTRGADIADDLEEEEEDAFTAEMEIMIAGEPDPHVHNCTPDLSYVAHRTCISPQRPCARGSPDNARILHWSSEGVLRLTASSSSSCSRRLRTAIPPSPDTHTTHVFAHSDIRI